MSQTRSDKVTHTNDFKFVGKACMGRSLEENTNTRGPSVLHILLSAFMCFAKFLQRLCITFMASKTSHCLTVDPIQSYVSESTKILY